LGVIDTAYTVIRSANGLWDSTSKLVYLSFILPSIAGVESDFVEVEGARSSVKSQLDFMGKNYFKNSDFVVGTELSIADLALATNLAHLEILDFDLSPYPIIQKFWNKIQLLDSYLISHALFYKILKDLKTRSRQQPRVSETKKEKVGSGSGSNIVSPIPEHRGEFLRLYHVPGTRGTRVLWLAYELGLDLIRVVQVKWTQLEKKEFRDINPNGKIPALVDESLESKNLFEGGAICDYLLDVVCPNNLLFPKTWTSDNWAKHLIWKHWTVVTLDGRLLSKMFGSGKFGNIINKTGQKIYENLIIPMLEKDLESHDYINGNEFTATDIYVGYTLFIADILKLVKGDNKISQYLARLKLRPAWGKAFPESLEM